jgi:ADP-heptose:LPS heptosyltransferase
MQKDIFKKITEFLGDGEVICFGELIGELGWELSIISPLIKLFKKENPNIKVIVATREDRAELYENSNIDDIFCFNIPGDYKTKTPRTNGLYDTPDNLSTHQVSPVDSDKLFSKVKESISIKYPSVKFFSFNDMPFMPNPQFDFSKFDYNFKPHPINSEIINNIIFKNPDKQVVTIFSRHRVDLAHRNWTESNWKELYKRLSEMNCIFFISGKSPSFIKPLKKYTNMFILENLSENYNKSSILGLTIDAVRNSKFTFGPQTAGILLSNFMRIPNIYFGKEEVLVSHKYNPYKTPYYFLNASYSSECEYIISVNDVFNGIKTFDNNLNNRIFNDKNFTYTDINKRIQEQQILFKQPNIHPALVGLTDEQRLEKIREINNNPHHYRPTLESTIIAKNKV